MAPVEYAKYLELLTSGQQVAMLVVGAAVLMLPLYLAIWPPNEQR